MKTLELQFALAAPPPPPWFEARMDEPEPLNHSTAPHEGDRASNSAKCSRCAWQDKRAAERSFQWPLAYGAAMGERVAARIALEAPPQPGELGGPPRINGFDPQNARAVHRG